MDYDLAIVGAGPAGLVAARTATELGLSHCVLEAKHRMGGRAYTEHECFGVPVDHGCHWLEGAEANPFRAYADRHGIAYQRSHRNEHLFGSGVWCPAEDAVAFSDYADQVWAAGREAAAAGNDMALAQVAPPNPRWAGLFGGWCAALTGFEPERVSTADLARYDERWGAWPVIDGYGALIARYGAEVQVQTDCPVRRIDWTGGGVVLETGPGSIKAKCALITVSTGVLAADRIRFEPQLPAWKRDAIDGIPMGPAAKVIVGVRAGFIDLPDSQYVRFDNGTSRTAGYQVRPYGRELVIANFAGSFAAELEAQGRDAMIEFVFSQLIEMFGGDLRRAVTGADATAWCGDPHVLGGYSIASPGYADCRPLLGEPVGGRLFFAGEAISLRAFGSAHGAYESARNAVHAIQGCLGAGNPPA
jgi:monoamine oxidase